MSEIITIPYKFIPRPYQLELFKAVDSGYKRAIAVYHRRAGKDKTLFNLTIKKALERIGTYYYFFPEFAQGRRVIWDGMDGSGMKFLDHLPPSLIKKMNSTDMKIELTNGSILQIIGTDKFNKVRGANPVGCVFSEFAYQNPMAWDVVRPILVENGGWAIFNSTPFGKNHFYQLCERVKDNKNWFFQTITVDDSKDEDGNPYVNPEVIQSEVDAGMSQAMVEQEFFCSFTSNAEGFYYLKYLNDAEKDGRIGNIPYGPEYGVDTWWDIGIGDNTAIWFTQTVGKEVHLINFYKKNSVGFEHYVKYLQSLPYTYNTHNFPFDSSKSEFGTGRTVFEMSQRLLGSSKVNILPKLSLEDGINAARVVFSRCLFDKHNCSEGLKSLYNYHRKWDDKYQEYQNKPVHDWSSDAADAFRYFAIGLTIPKTKKKRMKKFKRFTTASWMVS